MDLAIKEYQWKDVREHIAEPALVNIIDELSPGKDFLIFKVSYPFGATIFDKGLFYLPDTHNNIIPVYHPDVPAHIREHLHYDHLPIGIASGRGVEVCAELEDRVFSLGYFEQGMNLGIWETFAPPTPFTVIAGARSLQMLPRVMEVTGYKRLKQKYKIQSSLPDNPFDQWYIYKDIANHKSQQEPWTCDIYFFSAKWAASIKNDPAWNKFLCFLWERVWKHTEYARNKVMLDTVWESFARILTKHRMKPSTYIVDTLKHLIFVAMGALPAFTPATNNMAAPIDDIMKAYLNDYGLKNYVPTLMQPGYFNLNEPNSLVYYSLHVPTCLESTPKYRALNSAKNDLIELIELMDRFMRELITNNLLNDSVQHIYEALSPIQFDYFHSEADENIGVYPTYDMPKEDPNLLYMPAAYTDRKFCEKSSFVRGCIRISKK